ncbi:MAG: formylglycine-generating enzyme family protein [Candidatus Sericytochromatia bacterium]|nr:formylglycine-generating enzyme family protein [Candidatus Sericytochromatia bacterium]
MSELVGRVLKDLLEQEGDALLESPQRLETVLLDLCPDEHRAIRLILLGLAGQAAESWRQSDHADLNQITTALSERFQTQFQIAPRFGQWIAEVWGIALGFLPLSLEPRNIFAEAEEEYRYALRAVLTQGPLTDSLQTELKRLQKNLLIDETDASRIAAEVQAEKTQQAQAPAQDISWQPMFKNSLEMHFVKIAPGSFSMGSPDYERQREDDETQHSVTLTRAWYMQTTPVTQAQWQAVTGHNPSDFKGPDLPVENVSWNDIQTIFLPRLNALGEGSYRLPTEAEWEYAARAGSTQAYYLRDDASQLDARAWYNNNSLFQTHPVGQKQPNAWGLYDCHGNVWEWCQDGYHGPYTADEATDPLGAAGGLGRVMRGGSWFCNASACRSAARGYMPPETRIRLIGFRLVRVDDSLLLGGQT